MRKNKYFSFIASLLIIALNFPCIIANAADIAPDTNIIYNTEYTLTPYEVSPSRVAPGLEYLIFRMDVTNLISLKSTYGTGKYFYKDTIPSDGYLFYVGKLTSSGGSIDVGIGFKNSANGEIVSVHESSFTSGQVSYSNNISPSNLRNNIMYLGYVDGRTNGPISGYVQYYYNDPNS